MNKFPIQKFSRNPFFQLQKIRNLRQEVEHHLDCCFLFRFLHPAGFEFSWFSGFLLVSSLDPWHLVRMLITGLLKLRMLSVFFFFFFFGPSIERL